MNRNLFQNEYNFSICYINFPYSKGGITIGKQKSPYMIVFAGMACLAIAMGIGRFAYTPLLPLMKEAEGFTSLLAGNLASINYVGYFIGALAAGVLKKRNTKKLYSFLLINILTTLLMGATTNVAFWMLLRLMSGVTSGLVFVFATSIILDELAKRGYSRLTGILYGGVGVGIFLSGLVVPLLPRSTYWTAGWLVLGGICCLFFLYIIYSLKGISGEVVVATNSQGGVKNSNNRKKINRLYLSYGCEGFGYIICATFLISMIADAEFFSWHPAFIWAVVGLAVIPSCIVWSRLGEKLGNIVALRLAFLLQIVGILLPVTVQHDLAAIVGALLFGATFMGITTLSITIGKELFQGSSTKVISHLTAFYSIGQILGPAVSGLFAYVYQGYEGVMIISAVVLGLALFSIKSMKDTNIEEEKACHM